MRDFANEQMLSAIFDMWPKDRGGNWDAEGRFEVRIAVCYCLSPRGKVTPQ